MGICDGRVVVITGAGRGIGREHALVLRPRGGQGRGQRPGRRDGRERLLDRARRRGRRRDPGHGRRGHRQRRRRLGLRRCGPPDPVGHRHLRDDRRAGQQRRHPARPHAGQHDHRGVGRRHQGPPARHLRPDPPRRGVLAQPDQGGRDQRRPHHQHDVAVGHLRQRRVRPTTARPRPASPRSPSSPPWSWAATGSPSTPSPRPP